MTFLRGLSVNAAATGLTYGLAFAAQSLIARGLGPAGRGQFALAVTGVMIVGLVLGEWLARGSGFVAGRQPERAGSVWRNCLLYCAVVLFLLLGIAAVAPGVVYGAASPAQALLLAGMAAFVVAQKGFAGLLQGLDRLTAFALVNLAFAVALLAGVLLNGGGRVGGVEAVMLVWLIAAILSAVTGGLPARGGGRADVGLLRTTAVVGGRGALSATLIYLLFRSDVYLVEHFLGEESLGVYAIAVVIAEMMQRGPNLAGAVLLPKVLRGGDDDHGMSLVVGRWVLLFSLVAAAGIWLLGAPFIDLVFGAPFAGAAEPLRWMLPGLVAAGFGSVLNTKLAGQGYPAITIWAPAVALAANVGLNLLWIPRYGLQGAALSTSAAYVLWAVVVTLAYRRITALPWVAFVRNRR